MPIDYKKYPKNWKTEIRPAVMSRAESKCEKCGIENYSVGWRDDKGEFVYSSLVKQQKTYKDAKAKADIMNATMNPISRSRYKRIVIVLTIAHLNHDINDNRMENLMALCQRCHNVMDAPYRAKNRAKNKK